MNIRARFRKLFKSTAHDQPAIDPHGESLQPLARLEESAPSDYPADVYDIPVLVISYFPVKGGQIDHQVTGDVSAPLETIRRHTVETTQRVIRALETGSMYHGYKDPGTQPSLRYQSLCPRIINQDIKPR